MTDITEVPRKDVYSVYNLSGEDGKDIVGYFYALNWKEAIKTAAAIKGLHSNDLISYYMTPKMVEALKCTIENEEG